MRHVARWLLAAVTVLLLGCGSGAVFSQQTAYFHHQAWSTEDGLPQASVHALLQSREGYLWLATEGGVARFDGQSFQVLSHANTPAFLSEDVSCLAQDGAGDLWFGTSDGLIRKHGDGFRRFSVAEGLGSDEVLAVRSTASGLYVLTPAGLAVLRGDRFVPVSDDVSGLSGADGGPALAVRRDGVYRLAPRGLALVAGPQTDGAPVLGVVLGAALGDEAVWSFGSNFVRVVSGMTSRVWRTGAELPGSRVQSLYVDRQGTAWIGTNHGLAFVTDGPAGRLQGVPELRGESVLSLLQDTEGDLWVGTEASGVHALQPRRFAMAPGSNDEAVTTVVRDSRGEMVFGTRDDGLFLNGERAVPIAAGKLTSPVILSLAAAPKGDLWAGTPDGLNHIEGGVEGGPVRRWTLAEGLPDNFVRSVLVAGDGTVWTGTRFGLVHLENGALHTFTGADGLRSSSIGPLLEVRSVEGGAEGLWVGTSAGLCRMRGSAFACVSAGAASVTALGADHDGAVWVALHGQGLALVADATLEPVRGSVLPREIVGIFADGSGYLWLRASHGLYRVALRELRACLGRSEECRDLKVSAYGRGDGMQSEETAGEGDAMAAEDAGGRLWFATRRGMAVTDSAHLLADTVKPAVFVTGARVDGAALDTSTPAKVSPGRRQYSFDYNGLSLSNPARVHYRYMLDGFDRGWIDAGSRRTAYYTNLPSGRYTFRVLAANGDGLWSEGGAAFAFSVSRPWYRSVWSYLLAFAFTALGVFAFAQLRVRAERRRFALVLQERTRVAREMHDTLAQELVSVSLQVELATQHARAGRLEEVTEQLGVARSLVRQALESARQSIWNLRSNLPKESLPVQLTARVGSVDRSRMTARLRIGGEYRSVTPAVENEVMRIASEAIANAERHAGATEMVVDLTYGADDLRLQVRDNGTGFDYRSARQRAGHYGLRGLEERAEVLGGQLVVETAPGQGSTVTLTAPLPVERV